MFYLSLCEEGASAVTLTTVARIRKTRDEAWADALALALAIAETFATVSVARVQGRAIMIRRPNNHVTIVRVESIAHCESAEDTE